MNKYFIISPGDSMQQLEEQDPILKARGKFVRRYCAEKGWSAGPNDLSWDQIMEIRGQEGWKNPTIEGGEA